MWLFKCRTGPERSCVQRRDGQGQRFERVMGGVRVMASRCSVPAKLSARHGSPGDILGYLRAAVMPARILVGLPLRPLIGHAVACLAAKAASTVASETLDMLCR